MDDKAKDADNDIENIGIISWTGNSVDNLIPNIILWTLYLTKYHSVIIINDINSIEIKYENDVIFVIEGFFINAMIVIMAIAIDVTAAENDGDILSNNLSNRYLLKSTNNIPTDNIILKIFPEANSLFLINE